MVDWISKLYEGKEIAFLGLVFTVFAGLWALYKQFSNRLIDENKIQAMVDKAIKERLAKQPVKNRSENEIEAIKKVLTKLLRSNEQDRKRAGVLFAKGDTDQAIKILSEINQKETGQINSQQQLTKQQIAQNTETKLELNAIKLSSNTLIMLQ